MYDTSPLTVREAASRMVVAALAPHVLAWIGLPLSLILVPSSACAALFLVMLFSPLFALPIAVCLGLPTVLALSRFVRLGMVACIASGATCGLLGMVMLCEWSGRTPSGSTRSPMLSGGEIAAVASLGAFVGGLFWALRRYVPPKSAIRRRLRKNDEDLTRC